MRIRWVESKDEEAVRKMFAQQGFEYEMPPLEGRNLVVRLVATDEANVPRMAVLGRRTLEAFLLVDRSYGTPVERRAMLLNLQNNACELAARVGYEDVQALLPPAIERRFGRRLRNEMGWVKNLWTCYSREL